MAIEEHKQNITDLKEGMVLAEFNMLREKAMRGELLIMSDEDGTIHEVPAREHFIALYGVEPETIDAANHVGDKCLI